MASDPFNIDQLTDKQKKIIQGLIKKFKDMSDEEKQEVIDILYDKGSDDVAEFFEKVRRVQKRSDKIDQIADRIIDRLS